MRLENVEIKERSKLKGMNIRSVWDKTGVTTLAIQKKGQVFRPNPSGDEIIEDNDKLIIIGTKARLPSLEEALEYFRKSDILINC